MPTKSAPPALPRLQAPPTGQYLAALHRSRWTVDQVAYHWRGGQPYNAPNSSLRTDGQNVYSYWHRVGETSPTGKKVAYLCDYSPTTSRHTRSLARVADLVVRCEEAHPPRG